MSRENYDNPFSGPLEGDAFIPSSSEPFESRLNNLSTMEASDPGKSSSVSQADAFEENKKNLRELCPTVEEEIVEILLQNNDNNFDRTLNELLSISDPTFSSLKSRDPALSTQTQLISDEEYAKALQEQELGPHIEQTRTDEEYARAIMASERWNLTEQENPHALALEDHENAQSSLHRTLIDENEGSGSGLGNLVEKSKRRLKGFFGKNNKCENQKSFSKNLASSRSTETHQSYVTPYSNYEEGSQSDDFSDLNVHQEVKLERRGPSVQPGQDFQFATNPSTSSNLMGSLAVDSPEKMNHIASVSHLGSKDSFPSRNENANNLSLIEGCSQGREKFSDTLNNPFMQDKPDSDQTCSTSVKPSYRKANPFE